MAIKEVFGTLRPKKNRIMTIYFKNERKLQLLKVRDIQILIKDPLETIP